MASCVEGKGPGRCSWPKTESKLGVNGAHWEPLGVNVGPKGGQSAPRSGPMSKSGTLLKPLKTDVFLMVLRVGATQVGAKMSPRSHFGGLWAPL